MGKDNLIVDEAELDAFCDNLCFYASNLDAKTKKYIKILLKSQSDSIISGEMAKALTDYIAFAKSLNNQFFNVAQHCKKKTKSFKTKIDADDQFLY